MSEATNKHDRFLSALAIGGASLPITEGALVGLAHGGTVGGIVALGASGFIWLIADEMAKHGRGIKLSANAVPVKREKPAGEHGVFYRMTHGKDTRDEGFDQDDDSKDTGVAPSMFMMDDVLDVIREFNRRGYVYFGDSLEGAIAIHLHDLIHILDISSSGKGKSNRQRLIMPQVARMAETYYINPLCNKIKPVKDNRQYEIWTPIYDLLAYPPVKEGDHIGELLAALVEEIKTRNGQEERNDFSWRERTVVLFVDELPEVYARCPEAPEYLDSIGRMGRQYNIQMYLCSQTAQVKDIGMSNAAQANFKTKIYGGGDQTSANKTMKGNVPAEKERVLQSEKGLTLMLADGLVGAPFVRAPLVTNTGLFDYLDLPSFRLDEWVAPSRSTSRLSVVSPSIAPSYSAKNGVSNQAVKSALKERNEGARRGLEGAEGDEGEMEGVETEELHLSEREEIIINSFLKGAGIGEIASKLADGATGGSKYQKASKEVQDTIREYMESMKG